MAYIDLHNTFTAGAEPFAFDSAALRPAQAASLSALEWLVVAVAEGDQLSSLKVPGKLAAMLGALFGSRRGTGLANPRLEVLRRLAVLLWRKGEAIEGEALNAFLAAGYTQAQYELVAASIETARKKRKR